MIVVWAREGGLYCQRLDNDGTVKWTPGGVPVCTETFNLDIESIMTDGSGGVIINWQHMVFIPPDSFHYDYYAQRVDSSGNPLWQSNGLPIHHPITAFDSIGGGIMYGRDRSS